MTYDEMINSVNSMNTISQYGTATVTENCAQQGQYYQPTSVSYPFYFPQQWQYYPPTSVSYPFYFPMPDPRIDQLQKEVAELKDMLKLCLKELLYLAR